MNEPATDGQPIIAAAVIVHDGQVLLIRRRVEEGRLSWQFPAGKVEPGESGCKAAVREALEEAGLAVRALSHLGERIHPDTGRRMRYIACEVIDGTAYVADTDEIADVAWCDRSTLAARVPYPLYGPVQKFLDDNAPEPNKGFLALAALMLAAFSYLTVETLPVGLLPVIAGDTGVSLTAAGLLVTGYGLTVAVVSLPLTHLVRGIPRRYLLSGLLAVFVIATCVSVIGNYWLLFAGRIVTALSQAVFWAVVAPAAAALFSPAVRGRVTAALFGGGSLATVLGVPAGTWLGQHAGWRVAFLAVAGLGLLSLIGVAVLVPTTTPEQGHAATGSAPDARRYWLVIAATAVAITGVFGAYTYISPFLTEVSGFAPPTISALLLIYGVAGLGGVAMGGVLADRAPRAAMLAPVAILTAALLALYLFGTHQAATVVLVALWGFAMPQIPATFQSRVLQVAPGSTDTASAVFSAMFNVGIAAGALVGGVLLSAIGVRSAYLVGGLLTAVAVAILLSEPVIGRRQRPQYDN